MIPAFRIVVAGEDVSGGIADRLLSLTIIDEDGERADRIEIELDDRDGRLEFPELEAKLEVSLGFRGQALAFMGVFAVDGVSGRGPLQSMQVSATAADLKSDARAPKTRAWEGKTLADIVSAIAGEAGLKPVVGQSVATTKWDYLAQTSESDLHFLSRIAATLDATCKPAGGALIVQKRGEGKTAAGDAMPTPSLSATRLSSWDWKLEGRKVYRSAQAEYRDTGTGQTHKIKHGDKSPLKVLRHLHASKDEADRAAKSALSGAARDAMSLSAELAGFDAGLLAGGSVTLTGMPRPELNAEWHLQTVTHALSGSGLVTSFKAKKGEP